VAALRLFASPRLSTTIQTDAAEPSPGSAHSIACH
jgi:hypothetical protein